jgi:CubicO group peptidase (beta-lactamase class C family)
MGNHQDQSWTGQHSLQLKDFVISAMTALQTPGLSIAVVQGGSIVYAEAFGVRSLTNPSPVTVQTRFMIGSATKPLATLMMARMVDQKKLNWSTSVVALLKDFALADRELTQRLELRHAASHCVGMPRRIEFLFRYSGSNPEARLAEMKTMQPTTGIGEVFYYSNYLFAAGGYAAARAVAPDATLEQAFETAMTEFVFRPLGMNDTFLRPEPALQGEAALPHANDVAGCPTAISFKLEKTCHSLSPAGGAWSTVHDMARYLMLELGNGCMPEGTRLVSEESLLERRKKNTKIAPGLSYGLGLFISEESGPRVIHHGGNTLGFSGDLFFIPEKGLGVVLLTNQGLAVGLVASIRQRVLDLVLGAGSKAEEILDGAIKKKAWRARTNSGVATDPASMAWIDAVLGLYRSEELGSARIIKKEDSYWIQFDTWASALGSETLYDGRHLLSMTTPPWCGNLVSIADTGELLLDAGSIKYVFQKQ